jgi:hypothetical protein
MRHNSFFLLWLLAAGCVTAPLPSNLPRVVNLFPANALMIQRAVLTVHGRQFTLNGYLAVSRTGGKRLIITENFGSVLADVLMKPNGNVYVIRSSRTFRPEWVRRYVVADLNCVFGSVPDADCPGRMLNPTHFVIERRNYMLDLQIVEIKPGLQPPEMFDEIKRGSP